MTQIFADKKEIRVPPLNPCRLRSILFMDTIKNILNWAAEYLGGFNIPSARLDSEIILAHTLNKDRTYLYQNFQFPISNFQFKRFRELIERRSKREPVSYITGEKEFWSLKFKVTRDTLIPRPETEILVQTVLEIIKGQGARGKGQELNILDIGTGSGNIAISIAKEVSESHIFAIDRSDAALAVAKENAITHGVAERITFLKGDLYDLGFRILDFGIKDAQIPNSKFQIPNLFDIIVSNPPYIPSCDIESLMPEVKDWEPREALDGGRDGLDTIRKIITDSPRLLKPAPAGFKQGSGRYIVMEIGFNQAEDVKNIIERTGKLSAIRFVKDLGGIERVVTAELKSISEVRVMG